MATWTPEQWAVFIGALAAALVTVIGALGAAGKVYIDYLNKSHTGEIKKLKAAVAKLQRDRTRDHRRIAQLVRVLEDNKIPVPPPEPEPDDEGDE
jgi:hypothetical protein